MKKTIAVVTLAIMVLVGASGCSLDDPSDQTNQTNITDLTQRGFKDPSYAGYKTGRYWAYGAGFGKCRIEVVRDADSAGWWYAAHSDKNKDGKTAVRDVDAAKLKARAEELGLKHCFA